VATTRGNQGNEEIEKEKSTVEKKLQNLRTAPQEVGGPIMRIKKHKRKDGPRWERGRVAFLKKKNLRES